MHTGRKEQQVYWSDRKSYLYQIVCQIAMCPKLWRINASFVKTGSKEEKLEVAVKNLCMYL